MAWIVTVTVAPYTMIGHGFGKKEEAESWIAKSVLVNQEFGWEWEYHIEEVLSESTRLAENRDRASEVLEGEGDSSRGFNRTD